MKLSLILLLAVCEVCSAAPFLYADPYPSTGIQPDAATVTINGGAAQPCQLVTVTNGLQPKCDLASISAAGTYTLVMTVTKAGGIVNTPGGATNTTGGTASSSPFTYRFQPGAVPGPVLSVAP